MPAGLLAAKIALLVCGCTPAPRPYFWDGVERPDTSGLRIKGLGTEPFWNFTLEPGAFGFGTPDMPGPRVTHVVLDFPDGGGIAFTGTFAGRPLRGRIAHEPCSDGMSDRRYPMSVRLTIEGRKLSGCAYHANPDA